MNNGAKQSVRRPALKSGYAAHFILRSALNSMVAYALYRM